MGRVVYMTGAWDLLHVGHVRALRKARAMGDILIVGVMSDKFILRSKGKTPIIPFEQRREIISTLYCVDCADKVDTHTDYSLLDTYHPSIRVVGPDYGEHEGHELALEEMRRRGIEVRVIPKTPDISTTAIVEKIRG